MFNRIIDNPIVQNVAPYLGGAALGGAGQQVMNWVTQGADPNPVMSAVLAAPAWGSYLRGRVPRNQYEQAAHNASLAGMVGGAGTSIYNTFAGGADIDNNTIAGGLALLGGIAPLTYSVIRNHHMRGDEIKNMDNISDVFPPVGTSRNPVNPKTGYYGSVGTSYPFDIANAPGYSGETIREDRLLDRLFNRSK